MRSAIVSLACAGLLAAAPSGQSPAPDAGFAVSLVDGSILAGRPLGLSVEGERRVLRWSVADGPVRDLALTDVLGVHGPPPTPAGGAVVRLVGGDELVGRLAAGDAAGETFVVKSPALGDVRVPIDRLAVIVFPERVDRVDSEQFELPADAPAEEALFVPAARGFDVEYGAIHRFVDAAVLFAVGDRPPVARPFTELAAIALQGGFDPEDEPEAVMLTRAGDRVSVRVEAVSEDAWTVVLEGDRPLRVGLGDLSALSFDGPGRTWLSALRPARVVEKAWFAEADEPLLPFRRNRSVTGSALCAGERTWVRGLGVHSRSELTWRVPQDASRFWTAVAIDAEVLELQIRGIARVAIRHGDEVVFEREVRSGEDPIPVGPIAVEPGQLLTLMVDYGPGLDLGDRVDWLGAVFLP